MKTLSSPPKDVELGRPREPIEYVVVTPDHGINDDTGLIFWIGGWGMSPTETYSAEKLMPHLANTANCIVVSVFYHGIRQKFSESILRFPSNWTQLMNERFGTPVDARPIDVFASLPSRGILQVPFEFEFSIVEDEVGDYLSWGFLPALDHIAVLGQVLADYPINKKRLIAMGTSYGGYIVNLMIKFMPNTFSCAIDNSGFTHTLPEQIASYELRSPIIGTGPSGLQVLMMRLSAFTFQDSNASNYFKEAFKQIRDLNCPGHMREGETKLYVFHSPEDTIAALDPKETFCIERQKYAPTELKSMTPADIDGALFKDMSHGMKASMRKMFGYVMTREGAMAKTRAENDFDDETQLSFNCGDMSYAFAYSKTGTVDVQLKPTTK